MSTISNAKIELPKTLLDKARVIGTVNGEEKVIIEFFHDEVHFTPKEINGKTEEEARRLHFEKDRNYLRS